MADAVRLTAAAYAAPLAMDHQWDRVRIDGAWHRTWWVSGWPTTEVGPQWLEPLLLDTVGTRTVTMIMEPVSPRASRRRISAEAVTIANNITTRQRHGFRVPVTLGRAKSDLDRREAEIVAGFAEYRYLALLDVSAPSAEELDEHCANYLDLAAQCGLDLRPLAGRHDAAWACTLPIGRAPDRDLIGGVS
jgi:hypothetical protein